MLVVPDGSGETLASIGITIRVYAKNYQGQPLPGIPAASIQLRSTFLCICSNGNIADGPTDAGGSTTFSGVIRAGGCAASLAVLVDGIQIATLPVKTRSPEMGTQSPCYIDASDESFSFRLGTKVGDGGSTGYTICLDLNGDGYIDLSDVARFSDYLGASCNP